MKSGDQARDLANIPILRRDVIRGHNLFDLVAYIGNLLCRGTSVSFKKDVLMSGIPPQSYWQIKKVAEDIATIV